MLAAAGSPPTGEVERLRPAFSAALARDDDEAAARLLDDMVRAWQSRLRRPAPSALINVLAGELTLRGMPYVAIGYLEAATRGLGKADLRARGIALARAYLATGQLVRASSALSRFQPDASSRGVQAELLLASDPAAAIAIVNDPQGVAHAGIDRSLVRAAALSLNGDPAGAERAAREVWNRIGRDAKATRQGALAAAMLATLAWRGGDMNAQIELTSSAVRGFDDPDAVVGSMTSGLPQCGADVREDDWLVVTVVAIDHTVRAIPVAASRPAVVRHFMDGLDASVILNPDQLADAAIPVLLKCRREPARYGTDHQPWLTAWGGWAARTGYYPLFRVWEHDGLALAEARSTLTAAGRRRGPRSPFLFAPIVKMIGLLAQDPNDEPRLMEAQGYLDRLTSLDYVRPGERQALRDVTPDLLWFIGNRIRRTDFDANVHTFAQRGDIETAVAMLLEVPDPGAPISRATRDLLARRAEAERGPTDRARRALAFVGMENARNDANYVAVRVFAGQAGLSPEACRSQDRVPRQIATSVTDAAYPAELMGLRFVSKGFVESDLDAGGKVITSRLIASAPAGLFDRLTEDNAMKATFEPAVRAGRPVPCRAARDSITWRPRPK